MDDVLCHGIGRGGLGPKEDAHRPLGQPARLDIQLLPNDIQGVHLLPLVLMEPLDLDVKDRLWVQGDGLLGPQQAAELILVVLLDSQQPLQHRRIVPEVQQVL